MIEIPFIPTEIAFTLVWIVGRVVCNIRRGHVDWGHELRLLLMYVNLAVIIRFLFFPFDTVDGHVQPLLFDASRIWPLRINLEPFTHILWYDTPRDAVINIVGNICMFIPTGIILPIVYKRLDSFFKVVGVGILMSLAIELIQLLFFDRATDIDDIILNTVGYAIGYFIYWLASRGNRSRILGAAALLIGVTCALVCAPQAAYARSYTVDGVYIGASVDNLGGVWITERRTYTFNGAFNGITWELPSGTFEGRVIEPEVYEIAVEAGGETTVLFATDKIVPTEGYRNEDGSYSVTITRAVEDETVTYRVSYLLPNLVSRWADVAELYWQYVPADPGGEAWHDITLEVTLPVPQDERVVAGDTVRAWGHGPLAGEVNVTADGAKFTCPVVEGDDYLEARVVFPESWVELAEQADEAKLDTILDEEAAWAKEANAKRARDRAVAYVIPGALIALGLGSVVFERVRAKLRSRKSATPTFTEEYLRDVPNGDHPVVWGQLMNDGKLGSDCFAATVMRLADRGCVSLDAVRDERDKSDWRISCTKTAAGLDAIDNAACDLLFKVVPDALGTQGSEPQVLVSQINEAAKEDPRAYSAAYTAWDTAAREAYKAAKYEKITSRKDDLVVGMVGLGGVALLVVLGLTGMLLGAPAWLLIIGIIVCFAGALWCIWHFDECEDDIYLTQKGADLRAQLEALKRWLLDFTNLKEAIPADVVLWNRLLVAATALGVAREVVKQLRVHVPELFKDENFLATSWVKGSTNSDAFELPFSQLAGAALRAKVEASDELGSSSSSSSSSKSSYDTRDSSYDGSGGGFSGGGGGGFSGGGRGGAF